jgi:hypothetical protein
MENKTENTVNGLAGDAPGTSEHAPSPGRRGFLHKYLSAATMFLAGTALLRSSATRQALLSVTPGAEGDSSGLPVRAVGQVTSVHELRSLRRSRRRRLVRVHGYHRAGDGGGGLFYVDNADSTSADNGGTSIVAKDGSRWKRVHSGEVSPEHFGAIGDGDTDDTANIRSCVAAASNKFDVVVSKQHKISAPIELSHNTVVRAGASGAKISYSGGMGKANLFHATGKTGIRLIGLEITGDKAEDAATTAYGSAVRLESCKDVQIVGLNCHTFSGSGINLANCTDFSINNCTISNILSNGGASGVSGINIEDNSYNGDIAQNRIENIGNAELGHIGIGIRVIRQNVTSPVPHAIHVRNNTVSHCCSHGIIMYDAHGPVPTSVPDSTIEDNIIDSTGMAQTRAENSVENALGAAVYCARVIPGSIQRNRISNTHVHANSTTIAEGAICLSVAIKDDVLPVNTVIRGNIITNPRRNGYQLQRVSGFSLSGGSITGCGETGLMIHGCQNFHVSDLTITGPASKDYGILLGASSGISSNFSISTRVSGFGTACQLTAPSNGKLDLDLSGFSVQGLLFLNGSAKISGTVKTATAQDVPALATDGASTGCSITLDSPNRGGYDCPYVRNNGSGVSVDTYADGTPNCGTWALGDTVRYRHPSPGRPSVVRCTGAGTPGVWTVIANAA